MALARVLALLPLALASCECRGEWPKVRWALRVWAFWPQLAELELKPQDVMPAAEQAVAGGFPSCKLAQLALQLFVLCSMGQAERSRALEESGEALMGEMTGLLSCRIAGIIESGWPLFSLLALLLRSSEPNVGSPWARRVAAGWRAPPEVGPPAPTEHLQTSPLAWLPGKRRPPHPPASGSGLAARWAANGAARAAKCQVPRYRSLYLRQVDAALSQLRLRRRKAPFRELCAEGLCESLSLLEMARFVRKAPSRRAEAPPAPRAALRAALRRLLHAARAEASNAAAVPGAVLPSEAALFRALAELQGVQVIVESGVGNGGSTRAACAWAHAMPGRRVVALERALKDSTARALAGPCRGVLELRPGDAFSDLDGALQSASSGNASVALLLDGPKGRVAVRMAEEALRRFPQLRVAAIHDVPRLDGRYRDAAGRHLTRVAMEESPCLQIFSDEPWYVANYARHLDINADWVDAAMDPVRQANLTAYVACAPKTGAVSFSAIYEKKQLIEARRKRSTMTFMERMDADAEQKQALAQVTVMRQNEDHRKALDRLVERMRPEPEALWGLPRGRWIRR
ncbi:unnamed protein product [Effrenium voratum]|nr:unnamed protein product [Effrenium voratum]